MTDRIRKKTNGIPVDDRCKCVEDVDTFDLAVATSTKACLELSDSTIRKSLTFECPS
jgi:hypothetical protein